MDGGSLWSVLTIVGPLLLGAVLLWALLRNRAHSSPAEIERTEQATRELYQEEDRAHRDEKI